VTKQVLFVGHESARVKRFTIKGLGQGEAMKRKGSTLAIIFSILLFLPPTLLLAVEVGDKAPDFELDSTKGGKLKLSSLRGKNVLINFYLLDYSPT
jgi:hypothetical protein